MATYKERVPQSGAMVLLEANVSDLTSDIPPSSYSLGTESELKKQWMNQLLALIQKKNSLMSEESDLMIE